MHNLVQTPYFVIPALVMLKHGSILHLIIQMTWGDYKSKKYTSLSSIL